MRVWTGAVVEKRAHSPCCVSSTDPPTFTASSNTIASRVHRALRNPGASNQSIGNVTPSTTAFETQSSGSPSNACNTRPGQTSATPRTIGHNARFTAVSTASR